MATRTLDALPLPERLNFKELLRIVSRYDALGSNPFDDPPDLVGMLLHAEEFANHSHWGDALVEIREKIGFATVEWDNLLSWTWTLTGSPEEKYDQLLSYIQIRAEEQS